MRLNEVTYTDAVPIDGYGPGFFRVGDEVRDAPLAILPSGVAAWGGFDDIETLLAASGTVDFVLIGTGADVAHIPAALREALEGAGIGVEVMSTPSACRTYNVLLAEDRRVATALIAI